jgi:GH25 family lysozyme M1 (1,4-beta-N-acetylmuramidase)
MADNFTTAKGCDLSVFQGDVDFNRVKKNADFAILRAGYGRLSSQKDEKFETYYNGCEANGIDKGVYWYSYAMSEDEARQEAAACLECIKGKRFEYPIYYDVEESKQFALGKEKLGAIIKAFLDTVEKAGYWVGLYSSSSALDSYIPDNIKTRYAVWVAHWGVSKPTYGGSYGMWQFTDKGNLDGINGAVDLDTAYIDYPSEIKKHGLNGYTYNSGESKPTCKKISVSVTIDGETYKGELTNG